MKWISALSLAVETGKAVSEAAAQIRAKLGAQRPDVVFVFATAQHRLEYSAISSGVNELLHPRFLLGCSGGGVIGDGREAEQVTALSLMAGVLPGVEIKPFHLADSALPDLDSGPRRWEEATGVAARKDPQFVILVDPLSIRTEEMLTGFDFAYPKSVKIGGLASGARRAGQNALFLNDQIYREGAVGLAFSGNLRVETIVAQGCRPFGRPLAITKCYRNVLLELDHRPALEMLGEMYREASPHDRELIPTSLFIGMAMDPFKEDAPQAGDFLVRMPIGMDTNRGALVIAALLREGQIVQFHLRDAQSASADLSATLKRYLSDHLSSGVGDALPPLPRGGLLFSCMGRGKHLYGKPDHDINLFRSEIGDVPMAGFFCNGEIGPVGGSTYIHGFTSCFGLFCQKETVK